MEIPFFKMKKLHKNAKIPTKRKEDAGYDFYITFDEKFKLLKPRELFIAPTKLACEIPINWVLLLFERGSSGSKGLSKRAGVIDSGYRGEIFIILDNTSKIPILFYENENEIDDFLRKNKLNRKNITLYPKSKAVAQGILMYCQNIEIEEVKELSSSIRGSGMLGSSGK